MKNIILEREYIYHISIPVSSCAYCELYNQDGNKMLLDNNMFNNFLNNKKNKVLVWKWKE